jgi:hypothetical protein
MKITIREVINKLKDIDYAIEQIRRCDEPDLVDAEDLLQEYATKIKDTQVDI